MEEQCCMNNNDSTRGVLAQNYWIILNYEKCVCKEELGGN